MLSDYSIRTTLPASDLERAKAFYRDALGFVPEHEAPEGLSYRTKTGSPFFVYPSGGSASGQHTQMGWDVPDIDAEVTELQSRGVEFIEYNSPPLKTVNGIATTGSVKAAWFNESEGNLIGLVQYLDSDLAWS